MKLMKMQFKISKPDGRTTLVKMSRLPLDRHDCVQTEPVYLHVRYVMRAS